MLQTATLICIVPPYPLTEGASDSSNVVFSYTLYYAAVCMCCIDFHWNCECGYVGHLRENGVLQSENVEKCETPICLCRSINSRHMPDFPMAVHFDFCHNHPILAGDVLRHRGVRPEARERLSQLLRDNQTESCPRGKEAHTCWSSTLLLCTRTWLCT